MPRSIVEERQLAVPSLPGVISGILIALAVVGLAASLMLIPLGVPGAWIMLAILLVGALAGHVGWWPLGALTLVAGMAEVAEFFIVREANLRYGGSNVAFWGAILGGFVGVIVGLPIPLVGSLVAGLLGTFLGAGLAAYWETQRFDESTRIGWGTLLGRALAVVVKTGAGLVILVWGGFELLVG